MRGGASNSSTAPQPHTGPWLRAKAFGGHGPAIRMYLLSHATPLAVVVFAVKWGAQDSATKGQGIALDHSRSLTASVLAAKGLMGLLNNQLLNLAFFHCGPSREMN